MNPSTDLDQLCGSKHCPGCGHKLQGKPVWDWLGRLPAGVKFDPTDQELIEHLGAKAEEVKDRKSHPLIDEFILTIEGEDGICYTHPEKLPGVSRDGLSKHFFHRPSKAYTTGTRKRRKIQTECGETRWHKTGKTRPVMVNGKPKGYKKILVLYTNFGKNRKPEKTNWVMHQYHLGQHEEEKEGELVVSKIFYQTQPRQCNWSSDRTTATTIIGISSTGSCSNLKEQVIPLRDDLSVALSSFCGANMDIPRLRSNHFSHTQFERSFVQVGIGEASTTRDASAQPTFDEPRHHPQLHDHHYQEQQQHQIATAAAFHFSRPSHPLSTIISPPPLHHTSFTLDEDSFNISRIMLQNESFQQQQHHKMGGSSASELLRGCTSTDESSISTPQDAEWFKYPSFWSDHDNQDHHG